jgi:hypothetical protein
VILLAFRLAAMLIVLMDTLSSQLQQELYCSTRLSPMILTVAAERVVGKIEPSMVRVDMNRQWVANPKEGSSHIPKDNSANAWFLVTRKGGSSVRDPLSRLNLLTRTEGLLLLLLYQASAIDV